ncbi:MAG TPA: hypothetical protein VHE54_14760 [Puia sp.]|nr:hypothetical protein [Puia sp.]
MEQVWQRKRDEQQVMQFLFLRLLLSAAAPAGPPLPGMTIAVGTRSGSLERIRRPDRLQKKIMSLPPNGKMASITAGSLDAAPSFTCLVSAFKGKIKHL